MRRRKRKNSRGVCARCPPACSSSHCSGIDSTRGDFRKGQVEKPRVRSEKVLQAVKRRARRFLQLNDEGEGERKREREGGSGKEKTQTSGLRNVGLEVDRQSMDELLRFNMKRGERERGVGEGRRKEGKTGDRVSRTTTRRCEKKGGIVDPFFFFLSSFFSFSDGAERLTHLDLFARVHLELERLGRLEHEHDRRSEPEPTNLVARPERLPAEHLRRFRVRRLRVRAGNDGALGRVCAKRLRERESKNSPTRKERGKPSQDTMRDQQTKSLGQEKNGINAPSQS